MNPKNSYLHGLDLLRFVAAMLVLLNHFATYATLKPEVVSDLSLRAYGFLEAFEDVGATGVQIFFVISGFVISRSAGSLTGRSGAMRFALLRAARILPALWISGVISLIALLLAGEDFLPLVDRFIRSALLSPIGPYIDGVVWSLVVEAVFYCLIGLSIMSFKPLPLVKIAMGLGIASSIYLLGVTAAMVAGNESLTALLMRFPFKVFLLRYGVFFAVGMLIWEAVDHKNSKGLLPAIILFSFMGLIEIGLQNASDSSRAVISITIWLMAMAWLLLSIRYDIGAGLRAQMRFLGNMSYTVYLNHYTTGMVIVFLLHGMGVTGVTSFAITLTSVLLISYVVLVLENRVRHALRAIINKDVQKAAPVTRS